MAKNFYLVLGLNVGASDEEIKSAYRRKAKQFHPDAGGDSNAFLDVQEGYHVLSHPQLRASYDRELSHEPQQPRRRRVSVDTDLREPSRRSFQRDLSLSHSFQTFGPSFEELFDRLWSNFSLRTPPKAERIEELSVDVLLTPEEVERGGEIRLMVPAQVECPSCGGETRVGGYSCWRCAGHGYIAGEFPVRVEYPAFMPKGYFVCLPLDHLGIRNFYLTARFQETAAPTD